MQMTPMLGARTVCLPQKGIAEPEKLKQLCPAFLTKYLQFMSWPQGSLCIFKDFLFLKTKNSTKSNFRVL